MSEQTLYERLGGEDAIAAVVDRFYERVLADDQLAGFFEDVDMQRQRAHQTQFLSAVAGGPVDYTGKDMQTVHADLEIRQSDFDAIATHLEETLVEFDVDDDDREAVLEAFGSYEDAIVMAAD
ncbi:group 1 truncated hemoglobin [Halobacteria archaeon AArc-m2/3/4]|uniref:Group 1 truncated hemoglobin n=1 Tax=Natronoglomus mannanivorans TaxID=2979990 RepID=A0AAP2YYP5_9EURY|nr:group 1 truncated hemoglobin [Halobacteria archaeon AArc-xg1-1]MCU4972335.1 group 1 truncated hemoglobin [Halobacteria archaeon AArc-m2/3/4]